MKDPSNSFHNTGVFNTGALNAGDNNTGDYNIGSANSGSRNEGSYNAGDFNLGNYNSGDWNLTDGSAGVFCTQATGLSFFDLPSSMSVTQWRHSAARRILAKTRTACWVYEKDMSHAEKEDNPDYKKAGGYLKTYSIREAFGILWHELTYAERAAIMGLPNFDADKFMQITGLNYIV